MRWLAGILVLLPLAAIAETGRPTVDAATIRACFDDADRDARLPACHSVEANACQMRPGGADTLGMTRCIALEAEVWGTLAAEQLALVSQEIGAAQSMPGFAADMTRAQAAWATWRDAECGLRGKVAGSIAPVLVALCRSERNALRAFELDRMRNSWHPTGARQPPERQ